MIDPRIELIPARPAVCSDESVTLDVLVRITPPVPEVHFPRAPLNVALVIDRSGSMAEGKKMRFAREAAAFAVQQLLPTDRVSVTVFDNEVETIVPGGLAVDKLAIVHQIHRITPRGSTDLHGGWAEGGRQAEAGLVPAGVNRVLLLSDGLANEGVVDPNTIAAEARGLAARGVGTTTMGVGDDYNEDLMESMAQAGDGRYYYIESPAQLVDILLKARLAWDAPRNRGRRTLRTELADLGVAPLVAWSALPEDPDVRMQAALLMVARAQKEAAGAAERGDHAGSRSWLGTARGWASSVPSSLETTAEMTAINELEAALEAGQNTAFIKGSKFRSFSRRRNQSPSPPLPPAPPPPPSK